MKKTYGWVVIDYSKLVIIHAVIEKPVYSEKGRKTKRTQRSTSPALFETKQLATDWATKNLKKLWGVQEVNFTDKHVSHECNVKAVEDVKE